MVRLSVLLFVTASLCAAAPVPKETGPDPKLLVGSWRYVRAESDEDALLICGTATLTFHADGKASATFGRGPDPKNGLFADSSGTYGLRGNTLTIKLARAKGQPETIVATVLEVTKTRIRITFPDDDRKRVTVMERLKSDGAEAEKK
jgi:hypothetical protein